MKCENLVGIVDKMTIFVTKLLINTVLFAFDYQILPFLFHKILFIQNHNITSDNREANKTAKQQNSKQSRPSSRCQQQQLQQHKLQLQQLQIHRHHYPIAPHHLLP